MPDELKPVLARQMEVYAGFLEHTDHHMGRLIDALEELGDLDDTLIYYIVGDNGASAEGSLNGSFNEIAHSERVAARDGEFMPRASTSSARPTAYNHYAVGWAHAMDTPYQWTKQVASHWGGTRNGTDRALAGGDPRQGRGARQFHHVIDVAPTVLEAAGLPEPTRSTASSRGRSRREHALLVRRRGRGERRTTQYFEMFCNRGIYHEGWTAVTRHSIPWMAPDAARSKTTCGSSTHPTTGRRRTTSPRRTGEARGAPAALPDEAEKYNVLPLDDRRIERFNPDLAGRPQLITGHVPAPVRRHGPPVRELDPRLKNKSHAITAEIEVPEGGANGVILSQGGAFGGFVLYANDGRPAYCYNLFGLQRFKVYGKEALPAGDIKFAWSSHTTVAGWGRVVTSH